MRNILILGLLAATATAAFIFPTLAQAPAATITPTATGKMPVVVEVFTSINCPNCPATESKLNDLAAGQSDFMVVMEHVDYWNDPSMGAHPDPYSSQDYTQRQYDFSNRLSDRPGSVFTPQPVLDGQWVASPPLWFNWSSKLAKAEKATPKAALQLTRDAKGALTVSWPTGLAGTYDLVLIGLVKDEHHPNVWRATGINTLEAKVLPNLSGHQQMGAGDQPKGQKLLVLLQERGGGPLRGMGQL